MPSTSVQISITSARIAAPNSDALKSLPPRPSVVVMPVPWLDPIKPPSTGTLPSRTNGSTERRQASAIASGCGSARVNVASVIITVHAST